MNLTYIHRVSYRYLRLYNISNNIAEKLPKHVHILILKTLGIFVKYLVQRMNFVTVTFEIIPKPLKTKRQSLNGMPFLLPFFIIRLYNLKMYILS